MTDQELHETWTTLSPTPDGRRRVNARVADWLDASDTSLAAEWLTAFRINPLGAAGLAAFSVLAMLVAGPLGIVARALVVLR